MPKREWTDEQREVARARAIKQGLGQKAKVATAVEGPSAEALLLAQAQATPAIHTKENLVDVVGEEVTQNDTGTVTHTKPGKVRVYKPTPYGYKAREIPSTNYPMAMRSGFLPNCPDCGGQCGDGINDCPVRTKRAYRICPIPQCGKKIHDYEQSEIDATEGDPDDPMVIRDDAYMQSTPELRTKAVMDKHMLQLHPNEAAAAGIVAPAQREVQRVSTV